MPRQARQEKPFPCAVLPASSTPYGRLIDRAVLLRMTDKQHHSGAEDAFEYGRMRGFLICHRQECFLVPTRDLP